MSKVLIVGCGQLGSRHLQAAAQVTGVTSIDVFDPNPASLALGQKRLSEIKGLDASINFSWSSDLSVFKSADLCIMATLAKGRVAVIKRIYAQTGARRYLIEKIVAQSVDEYKSLMDFAKANKLDIWVNCKTRAYVIHQYIRSKLGQEPIVFTAVGGNHGLATNGVHEADLFLFYDGSKQMDLVSSQIDPNIITSKRGNDIFDLSGTITAKTNKGGQFMVSFAGDHLSPDLITITTSKARFVVDHFQKFALESYASEDWKIKPLVVDEDWTVSNISKAFVHDILTSGACKLPTLEECYPSHKFILETLKAPFNALLNTDNDFCPVT